MLTIGSRGSQLALWQANWIKQQLETRGETCRIQIIKTTGDRITDVPLARVGTKGLFTKEIEEALLAEEVDVAVHSLKDLPVELPRGLAVAAFPPREDPRDAMIGCALEDLPRGVRVGTSSLRRAAQLKILRPDLNIDSVRGNVDTRLGKVSAGQYHAIVLAAAGLKRLGWQDRIAQILDPSVMCPAVGQGALAIETRESGRARGICAELDDPATRVAVECERTILEAFGGGCQVPLGAYARIASGGISVLAVAASPEGTACLRESAEGPVEQARELGKSVARRLLDNGAAAILEEVYGAAGGRSR